MHKNGHAYLILSDSKETTCLSGSQRTISCLKDTTASLFSNQDESDLSRFNQQGSNNEFIKMSLKVSFEEALFWVISNSAFEMIKCDSKLAIFRKTSRQEKRNDEDKEDFFIPENSSFKAEVIEWFPLKLIQYRTYNNFHFNSHMPDNLYAL